MTAGNPSLLPDVSTFFVFRVSSCVYVLSSASLLYLPVVFCVSGVIPTCCSDEWTHRSEIRDPHRDPSISLSDRDDEKLGPPSKRQESESVSSKKGKSIIDGWNQALPSDCSSL